MRRQDRCLVKRLSLMLLVVGLMQLTMVLDVALMSRYRQEGGSNI